LVVLLIWLSIYSFFNFLGELNSIGQFDYTVLEAIKYIILQMPEVAYKQASPIILLGCVLGMGYLSTTNQLVVLQVSGNSVLKLTALTVRTALIFVFMIIFIVGYLISISGKTYVSETPSKYTEIIDKFVNFFASFNVVLDSELMLIIGGVLTVMLLISGYFMFEEHRSFKHKLENYL